MHLAASILLWSVLRVTSRVWKQSASGRVLSWSARVAVPIHRELHDSCSSHQTQSRHLSLVSSILVKSDLLHRANSLQIELSTSRFQWNSHYKSPVAVASNVQSQNRAWKQVVNTRHGRDRNVSEKFWWPVCCIPNTFLHTCSSRHPAQTSAARKRNVNEDRNVSTCSTTPQRSQLNDPVHSCRS